VIAVLVAARDEAARARLEAALAGARGLRLVAGPSGAPLARRVAAAHPEVVLLDLDAPRIASLVDDLRDEERAALVVLADAPARLLRETAASRDLVRAVLPRDATAAEIRAAIEAVVAGLVALHSDALEPASRATPVPATARAESDQPLTDRELEVLGMMADGLGNKIIAARLRISTHTAKFHVASIMAKLGAGSRTEAVAIGMRRGLVAI
jgi:two-component system, NarL family, response regulator YdfI